MLDVAQTVPLGVIGPVVGGLVDRLYKLELLYLVALLHAFLSKQLAEFSTTTKESMIRYTNLTIFVSIHCKLYIVIVKL